MRNALIKKVVIYSSIFLLHSSGINLVTNRALASSEDPEAKLLHVEAFNLYKKANSAYLSDPNHTEAYIDINNGNGKRSVEKQKRLYEAFVQTLKDCGGTGRKPPGIHGANLPGNSLHQYGFAIDVIRNRDEKLIDKYLKANGWDPVHSKDEGWHFEAVSAPNYNRVKLEIKEKVYPVALKYGHAICSVFIHKKTITTGLTKYNNQRKLIITKRKELAIKKNDQRKKYLKLKKKHNVIQKQKGKLQNFQNKFRRLSKKIRTKRYTYCPNKKPFNQCNHRSLKKRYQQEKKSLIHQRNSIAKSIRMEKSIIQKLITEYRLEHVNYSNNLRAFKKEQIAFRKQETENKKLLIKINRARRNIPIKEKESEMIFLEVKQLVQSVSALMN